MLSQFTLQNLGSLGEFVGAIGVVVSIVYLARQGWSGSVRALVRQGLLQ